MCVCVCVCVCVCCFAVLHKLVCAWIRDTAEHSELTVLSTYEALSVEVQPFASDTSLQHPLGLACNHLKGVFCCMPGADLCCPDSAGSRFVPKPEERLLAVVHALLLRCYKLPFSNAADVPTSLKRELHGVCKACFSSDTVNRHSRSSKAAVATIADYKDRFIHDLNPEAPGFPSTLGDLATKLKVSLAYLLPELCAYPAQQLNVMHCRPLLCC